VGRPPRLVCFGFSTDLHYLAYGRFVVGAKLLLLCLWLVVSVFALACTREGEPDPIGEHEPIFYRGLAVEPRYSKSLVERPHTRYAFEPVLQGDIVRHDFLIENDSARALELSGVKACCGFLVESYSRRIEPGLTGRISTLVLTDSRGGQQIRGTIHARTDDESRPEIAIDVSLLVKEFASLSDYRIWLRGSAKDDLVETCRVIPNGEYPFSITGIKARKGVWFDYSYEEIEANGERGYEITVRNTREKIGSYQDVLFVQTDNSARPEFKIRIEGRISE
jgi:hypothetical protein